MDYFNEYINFPVIGKKKAYQSMSLKFKRNPSATFNLNHQNFAELKKRKCVIIDKSLIVKELLDPCFPKVTMITRPRKWGKSFNLSLIRYFFSKCQEEEIREKADFFSRLKIGKLYPDYLSEIGQTPVIYISFQCEGPEYQTFLHGLQKCIANAFRAHEYLYENLLLLQNSLEGIEGDSNDLNLINDQIRRFERLMISKSEANEQDLVGSINFLVDMTFKFHKKPIILLLDDLDHAIIHPYTQNFTVLIADEQSKIQAKLDMRVIQRFMANLIAPVCREDDRIRYVIMAGITDTVIEAGNPEFMSVFRADSGEPKLGEHFGVDKEELLSLMAEIFGYIKPESQDRIVEDIDKMYRGYVLPGKTIFVSKKNQNKSFKKLNEDSIKNNDSEEEKKEAPDEKKVVDQKIDEAEEEEKKQENTTVESEQKQEDESKDNNLVENNPQKEDLPKNLCSNEEDKKEESSLENSKESENQPTLSKSILHPDLFNDPQTVFEPSSNFKPKKTVYNIFSVMCYFQDLCRHYEDQAKGEFFPKPYWKNSGVSGLIERIKIWRRMPEFGFLLLRIWAQESLSFEEFPIRKQTLGDYLNGTLTQATNLMAWLLFQTGYLTFSASGDSVLIPNEEVALAFNESFIPHYFSCADEIDSSLIHDFLEKASQTLDDKQKLQKSVNNFLYEMVKKNGPFVWKHYQTLLPCFCHFAYLKARYFIKFMPIMQTPGVYIPNPLAKTLYNCKIILIDEYMHRWWDRREDIENAKENGLWKLLCESKIQAALSRPEIAEFKEVASIILRPFVYHPERFHDLWANSFECFTYTLGQIERLVMFFERRLPSEIKKIPNSKEAFEVCIENRGKVCRFYKAANLKELLKSILARNIEQFPDFVEEKPQIGISLEPKSIESSGDERKRKFIPEKPVKKEMEGLPLSIRQMNCLKRKVICNEAGLENQRKNVRFE